MPTPETVEWVACSCCGSNIRDIPADNLDFQTRGQDTGYGHCRECFGEPSVKGTDDAAVRKRLGWAGRMFYESRFDTVHKALSPENQSKWDKCSYAKKVAVIGQFIEQGKMI